jgi:hypothetical protein
VLSQTAKRQVLAARPALRRASVHPRVRLLGRVVERDAGPADGLGSVQAASTASSSPARHGRRCRRPAVISTGSTPAVCRGTHGLRDPFHAYDA